MCLLIERLLSLLQSLKAFRFEQMKFRPSFIRRRFSIQVKNVDPAKMAFLFIYFLLLLLLHFQSRDHPP